LSKKVDTTTEVTTVIVSNITTTTQTKKGGHTKTTVQDTTDPEAVDVVAVLDEEGEHAFRIITLAITTRTIIKDSY